MTADIPRRTVDCAVLDDAALALLLQRGDRAAFRELMQRSNTGQMIFSCAEIVAYLSRFVTLMPGDVVTTGTPPGVGLGMNPPRYLQAGDVVTLGITGLGVQRQEVRAYR